MALNDTQLLDLIDKMNSNVDEILVIMRGMSERLFTLEEKVSELEDDDES